MTSGVYTLSLEGSLGDTVYFSDRPARRVGLIPTAVLLEQLGFTPADPPNAALVAQTADGEDILVVELMNPRYDEAARPLPTMSAFSPTTPGTGLADLVAGKPTISSPPPSRRLISSSTAAAKGSAGMGRSRCASAASASSWGPGVPLRERHPQPLLRPGDEMRDQSGQPAGQHRSCWYP